jgi:serine phosphatase RsbU (regulator of sigma subunit)
VDAILNEKIVESCIKNKESGHFTSYFASVSGKNYWLKREITPIFDKNDNLRKIVALDSDVTLFKMAEEEIKNQHLEMENQRDIALIQKDKIMSQNIGITDSIKYAQKIQSALLPSENSVARYFKEYFIINKPRDIVSGDFYWISYKEDKIITVVADCTGHGVPGAFMSILGIASLEDLVNNSTFISAENLLFKLRENVISSLNTTSNEVESKDGMDMALCIFDLKNMILDFAGAYNPLYLIRDGNLKVYKADRMPIGVHPHDKKLFTSKKILIEKGDRFYMFSDGYIDQFGWRNGKKFKTKQFKELIVTNSNLPMKAQRIIIENTLENWKGDFEQVDDILIMGLKV